MRQWWRGTKGFSLIEVIIVIALLAVLAGVVVPNVVRYLGEGKKSAYNSEASIIQVAVSAYYSAPDNPKWKGVRQYPIYGQDADGTVAMTTAGKNENVALTAGENPDRGTTGGSPVWEDDDNSGFRDVAEKWTGATTTKGTTAYYFSTGNYIIDMDLLVTAGYLKSLPKSASVDNSATGTGRYTWYIKADGTVDSLYYELPTSAKAGFQAGVYP